MEDYEINEMFSICHQKVQEIDSKSKEEKKKVKNQLLNFLSKKEEKATIKLEGVKKLKNIVGNCGDEEFKILTNMFMEAQRTGDNIEKDEGINKTKEEEEEAEEAEQIGKKVKVKECEEEGNMLKKKRKRAYSAQFVTRSHLIF